MKPNSLRSAGHSLQTQRGRQVKENGWKAGSPANINQKEAGVFTSLSAKGALRARERQVSSDESAGPPRTHTSPERVGADYRAPEQMEEKAERMAGRTRQVHSHSRPPRRTSAKRGRTAQRSEQGAELNICPHRQRPLSPDGPPASGARSSQEPAEHVPRGTIRPTSAGETDQTGACSGAP